MDKVLEDYLWNEIGDPDENFKRSKRLARDVINEMVERKWINSPKQAWRTLEKWKAKGKYNYGTSLDLGWKEKS